MEFRKSIMVILLSSMAILEVVVSAVNVTVKPRVPFCTKDTLNVDWWSIPPYIYKDNKGDMKGIFKEVLDPIIDKCCNGHTNISYATHPKRDAEEVNYRIGENGTIISFPVYGEMKDTRFNKHVFVPVVEAPGIAYITTSDDSTTASNVVIAAVFHSWPIMFFSILMAALSGVIIWALDNQWNPQEFPPTFFHGVWEGFWWAFVSMTTVGYGDRCPRSLSARAFSIIWIMIGVATISIFTANVAASLQASNAIKEISLFGMNVVVLKSTEEYRFAVQNSARLTSRDDISSLKDAIINKERGVTAALLDSYVAGYWARNVDNSQGTPLDDPELHVSGIFEKQFAYGFVIAGAYENNKDFEKCVRREMNSMETQVTTIIKDRINTMEEKKSTTTSVFDPSSPMYLKALLAAIGLVIGLTAIGLIWEHYYWAPRQLVPKTTEVTRTIQPHTSYEELKLSQSSEMGEMMSDNVDRFFITWNRKLQDLEQRNSRLQEALEAKKRLEDLEERERRQQEVMEAQKKLDDLQGNGEKEGSDLKEISGNEDEKPGLKATRNENTTASCYF